MKKKLVKLYLTEDRRLLIKDSTGKEMLINIFNGGGYYTDFMIQTQEEIDKDNERRVKAYKEEDARIKNRIMEQEKKKWWKF
jgi:hypothetical protein